MVNFIGSYEHSECGLACVAMMIDYYGEDVTLAQLREKYGVPMGGYSISQMVQVLEDYHIQAKAIKTDNIAELQRLKIPFIAYWNKNHFVVVEKIKQNEVKIIDPAQGKRKVSIEEFTKSFSSALIYITSEKKHKKKNVDKTLINIVKKSKREIALSLAMSFILQLIALYIPVYIKRLIDNYQTNSNYAKLLLVMLGIILFYYSFSLIKMRIITSFQNSFDRDLSSITIGHLLKLPYKFFVNRGKGEIIFTINCNQYIRAILSNQMLSLFLDIIFLVLYFLLMFSYSVELSIITIVLGVTLVMVSVINSKIIIKKNETQLTNITDVQNITGEIVNNIETLKAIGAEDEYYEKWSQSFEKQLKMEIEKAKIDSALGNIPVAIQAVYTLIIFVVGVIIKAKSNLSLGTIVAFNTIGVSFLGPMLSLANSYLQLSAVKIYINQLIDVIHSKPENEEKNSRLTVLENGKIEVKNLHYKYDYFSKEVLRNINITVKDKEKVAIVGKSGSGKSTFLMLLAGMFVSSSGEICVGNQQISKEEVNKNNYRKQLGIVLQKSMLFNGTVKENIEMGRKVKEGEFERAVYNADLTELIESFSAKENTIISEDGSNISGGQKQRLCIARAILKQPKVILLDEPTSSLDNVSERRIMEHLFQMQSTVIVVAHRLSNIERFDKIIVLKDGEVEATGTHDELLKTSQCYRELYYKGV